MTNHFLSIINNAVRMGFEPDEYEILVKITDQAETFIIKNQIEEYIKEIYVDLEMVSAFGYRLNNGGWCDVDSPGGLINWDEHKDKHGGDKVFFYSALDSDNFTVLKFYDYAEKRYLLPYQR